jgi:sugar (pentulose or hexulose) kinase
MRVLALDVGSSSVKAGLWDSKRRRVEQRTRVTFSTQFEGSKAEIRPADLLRAVRQAGKEAAQSAGTIDAVSFCAFSSGVVVTSSPDHAPRTPVITHADRRSIAAARDLVRACGKRWWLDRTANLPYPGGIGGSTLAWLRRHAPGVFRGAYGVAQVSSLVGHLISGQWVTDPSQAVFLGLWDVRRQVWSKEACGAVGLDSSALPRVQWADEPIGGVCAALARHWNILSGTPVVGGFIDTSAAVIQAPMTTGQLVHNIGSTAVLAMCLDEPQPAEGILTRPVGVGRHYPERWLAVRTMASAGSALQWVRETMFRELSGEAWKRMLVKCMAKALAEGLPACDPLFAGERIAVEQPAGASLHRLSLATTREELLAAVAAGLARRSADDYARLAALQRPRKQVLHMGAADALAASMHRAWPRKHEFKRLEGDSLAGLGEMAARAVSGS